MLSLKERWIVVTGASSGLGRSLALHLALQEGAHVWLCARRENRLIDLKNEIEARSNSKAEVLRVDLSREQDRQALLQAVSRDGRVSGLINNAGMTRYGAMAYADRFAYRLMLEVNLAAVMELSLGFVEILREQRDGFVLNVTSEAAFVPTPYQGVYAITKHGIQAFTDALRMEHRRSSIYIGTFVPGGIRTEMITGSGLDKRIPRDSWFNMTPERAASACVRGIKRKRAMTVPGLLNKVSHQVNRLMPRAWVLRAAERLYRPPS